MVNDNKAKQDSDIGIMLWLSTEHKTGDMMESNTQHGIWMEGFEKMLGDFI